MKNIIPLILCGAFLLSCKTNDNQNLTEYSFMPEIYPYTDTIYAEHLNTVPFFSLGEEKNGKIIFYLNGDCSACFVQITDFQKFVESHKDLLNKKEIRTAVVIHSEQLDMLEYNLENIPGTLPIYIDTAQYFSTYNSVPLLQTSMALLDSNNAVIYSSLTHPGKNHYKKMVQAVKKME